MKKISYRGYRFPPEIIRKRGLKTALNCSKLNGPVPCVPSLEREMVSQSDADTSSHTTGRMSSSKARVQIVGRVSGRRNWTVEQKLAIIGDAFTSGSSWRARLSGTRSTVPVAAIGQMKRPFSRRLANKHRNRPTAVTTELLERIARLYSVEEEVRGQPPDTRRATRQARSKPQLDELRARMRRYPCRAFGEKRACRRHNLRA